MKMPEPDESGDFLPVHVKNLVEFLNDTQIRELPDLVDYSQNCAKALTTGEIKPATSKELRHWGELMLSCLAAGDPDKDVNVIGQLIQVANLSAPRDSTPIPRTYVTQEDSPE